MNYYYQKTEPQLWTVGTGENESWNPESDWDNKELAAHRVAWLNGSGGGKTWQEFAGHLPGWDQN